MPLDLARALMADDTTSRSGLAAALFATVTRGVPFVRAVLDEQAVTPARLADACARADVPDVPEGVKVTPMRELVEQLPTGLCERLLALPVRRDGEAGTVDVALVDPSDLHAAREIAYHLGATVRVVRCSLGAMEEALAAQRPAEAKPSARPRKKARPHLVVEPDDLPPAVAPSPGGPARRRQDTPPWGTPVHAPPPSEAPRSGLGSEIPIPLTRRTFTAVAGGTRRPPPLPDREASAPVEAEPAIPGPPRAPRHVGNPASEPPPTSLAAAELRAADGRRVVLDLRSASTRDQILDLLLAGTRLAARRVALFVVKRGGYQGWSAVEGLGARDTIQAVTLPLDGGSILDDAVREGSFVGPLPRSAANAPLAALLGRQPGDVAVVAVRVLRKAAVLVVADQLDDTMNATRQMEELAEATGAALTRLVQKAVPKSRP